MRTHIHTHIHMRATYRIEPHSVELSLVRLLDLHHPLAALRASRVLPFGLDALLEEVEVHAGIQPARWHDIIVQTASRRHVIRTGAYIHHTMYRETTRRRQEGSAHQHVGQIFSHTRAPTDKHNDICQSLPPRKDRSFPFPSSS